MIRKRNASQLAAAFVVTVAGAGAGSGCGPTYGPNPPPPQSEISRQPDGKCIETISGNPPMSREVPCPESMGGPSPSASASSSATAAPTADPTAAPTAGLEPAPKGWHVRANGDGTCTAYGPDPCNHPGCNPPPPMQVACPPQKQEKK